MTLHSAVFDYRVNARISALIMGKHKSNQSGSSTDYYKNSRFLDEPDPRRLDLRVSVTDPMQTIYVKSFKQRSKLDVMLFIDGSSSMLFADKIQLVAEIYQSIQKSVTAAGDQFSSFLIADKLTRLNEHDDIERWLQQSGSRSNKAKATEHIYRHLPARPALIFIVSDFYWQTNQFASLMTLLSHHWVVPVVLWQSKEYLDFPLWRFVELTDLETGKRGLVFVSKKQKAQLANQYSQAKQQLTNRFRAFRQRPFWLIDQYQARQMSQYFAAL